jgi:hypothetical protein
MSFSDISQNATQQGLFRQAGVTLPPCLSHHASVPRNQKKIGIVRERPPSVQICFNPLKVRPVSLERSVY